MVGARAAFAAATVALALWTATAAECLAPSLACKYSAASPRLTTTVAGILGSQGPINGVTGDGGPATAARLRTPRSIAIDTGRRVLYLVEKQNHAVRRIDLEFGGLSTLVGSLGSHAREGDKGHPNLATLREPLGVTVDPSTHKVYVADTGNHVVRCLDVASGALTTIAGIPGSGGTAGDFVPATTAQLRFPRGVVVDAMKRQLYVADTYNHAVRVVDLSTGIISTVAGVLGYGGRRTGVSGIATQSELYFPSDVTIDPVAQQLFIADTNNHVIRMVDLSTGVLSTVVGVLGQPGMRYDTGPATTAELHLPSGVDIDWAARQVYIADTNNHAIRQFDIATATLTTVAGTLGKMGFMGEQESATSAQLYLPTGVVVDPRPEARALYVADSHNHVVRMVELESFVLTTTAGILGSHGFAGDGGLATMAEFHHPRDIAVDATRQQLYVADTSNHAIRLVDLTTGAMSTVAGSLGLSGSTKDRLHLPYGVAFDSESRRLYVADTSNHAVRVTELPDELHPGDSQYPLPIFVTIAGTLGMEGTADDVGPANAAQLRSPYGIAIDPAGQRLFISDTANHAVRLLNLTSGILSRLVGQTGTFGFTGDGGPAIEALINLPYGIDFDASSQQVFVADCRNHAIRAVDLMTETVSTVAGVLGSYGHAGDGEPATSAQLYFPFGVAIDSIARHLYIADNWNHAIRLLNLVTGTLTTVAGTLGEYGRSGDGGRATWARLHSPMGLAVDSAHRRLYVSDASNHAVRRLAVSNDVRVVSQVADSSGSSSAIMSDPTSMNNSNNSNATEVSNLTHVTV